MCELLSITPCCPFKIMWSFSGTCCFHLQGRRMSKGRNQHEEVASCKNPNSYMRLIWLRIGTSDERFHFLLVFVSCTVGVCACSGFLDFLSRSIFLVILHLSFHQGYKIFKTFQWDARFINYFQMPISFRLVLQNSFLKTKGNQLRLYDFILDFIRPNPSSLQIVNISYLLPEYYYNLFCRIPYYAVI
jgi:hypothetical protein